MKELKIIEQVALHNVNLTTYQSVTFDGDCYYFCVEAKKIIDVYDIKFHKVKTHNTNKEYGCIVYNSKQNYFFAIPKYNANVIVKLNTNMEEIGYINIVNLFCNMDCITSLSYCCLEDSIVLATRNKVVKISIKGNSIGEVITFKSDCILKVISITPGYIIITEENEMYKLSVYDCNLHIVHEECFVKYGVLYDALFNPCENFSNVKCEQYATIYLLVKNDNDCSQIYQIAIAYDELGYDLNECNFKICKELPKPCVEIDTTCLIDTITIIQGSIAHILNVEGEKIQKLLATTNNISEFLSINKEVEQLMIKITLLEQVLYDSLVECMKKNSCCDKENKCICDIDGGTV